MVLAKGPVCTVFCSRKVVYLWTRKGHVAKGLPAQSDGEKENFIITDIFQVTCEFQQT